MDAQHALHWAAGQIPAASQAAAAPLPDSPAQMAIKPILIVCGLILTIFYFRRLRSALLDRLLVAGAFIAMVVFVLNPEWTDLISRRFFGVEGGRWLLMYFSVVFYLFLFMLLFSHVKRVERDLSSIVRMMAIHQARKPEETAPAPPAATESAVDGEDKT